MSNAILQRLEDRMARLEEELKQIKALLTKEKEPTKPWWQPAEGQPLNDEAEEWVARYIQEERRKDYERAAREADRAETAAKSRRKKATTKRQG